MVGLVPLYSAHFLSHVRIQGEGNRYSLGNGSSPDNGHGEALILGFLASCQESAYLLPSSHTYMRKRSSTSQQGAFCSLTHIFPREEKLLWFWQQEEGIETNSLHPFSFLECKVFRTRAFFHPMPGRFYFHKVWCCEYISSIFSWGGEHWRETVYSWL